MKTNSVPVLRMQSHHYALEKFLSGELRRNDDGSFSSKRDGVWIPTEILKPKTASLVGHAYKKVAEVVGMLTDVGFAEGEDTALAKATEALVLLERYIGDDVFGKGWSDNAIS